jgi:MoxR-like ATPase
MSSDGFASVADCVAKLDAVDYLIDRDAATVTYLAARMGKPMLVEGPAGVGKTELARALAGALGRELVRLQCYEGLDEAKALYEWEYAKQLLYTQILRDKIGETVGDATTLREAVERIASQDDVFFSDRFLLPRPLLRAILSDQACVLLVDEIDKADAEFEAFLLEVLSDFQVTVPELGTLTAHTHPLVVLTSNNARELSDALRRRCLHLHLDFPDVERERAILRRRVPEAPDELSRAVAAAMVRLRALGLRKLPSISESIDWVRALVLLNVDHLDPEVVTSTLSLVLKYEGDVRKGRENVTALLS